VIPVLPDPSVLAPFAFAVVVIALTPGPDMTFFVGRALTRGRAAGIAALTGALSGVVVHTLAVALGLSALIVAAPKAFLALKVAGAAYLLWLAFQAIRRGSAFTLPSRPSGRAGLAGTWASGVAINLLNPKIVLFFMTFLPQFVSSADADARGKLIALGLIFIAMAFVICLPMVLAADRFAAAMRASPRISRAIDWLFAGVFSAFAVQILFSRAR
jgi:threonine/homoserine/homoserine lactone efflux protein